MRFGKLLAPQEPCDWSPDGKFIIYGDGQTDTGDDLWLLPMSGERKPTVTTASGFEAGNPAALFSSGTEYRAMTSQPMGSGSL